ncbi:hypothetical protein DPMN_082116 [Dreissena polymorpha]|uniref:Uncharacterized protein n=1 Tax=Dreissena polymorpha TaxID=45954 RepID=A0A9D4BGJ4_DREPO|nr:hypothetical protein DPMN_082116 [Dreissena polymorpha]
MANNIAPSCWIQTRSSADGKSPQQREGSKDKGSSVFINNEVNDWEISVLNRTTIRFSSRSGRNSTRHSKHGLPPKMPRRLLTTVTQSITSRSRSRRFIPA